MNVATLNSLYGKYGVDLIEPPSMGALKPVKAGRDLNEEGITGTRFGRGLPNVDPATKYGPFQVRGASSSPGFYEEFLRSEPLIYDAGQSYIEILASGTWDMPMPRNVPIGLRGELQSWIDFHRNRLQYLDNGGWTRHVEHAGSFVFFGFAVHEVVWAEDKAGRAYIRKLAYREQSTVEEWVLDERGDSLVAVKFATGGDEQIRYTLPATGAKITDHKVLLQNLAARGNNFEGISPIRPALHYIRFKRLLMQIAAAAAEKYGVPITYVMEDPEWAKSFNSTADGDDLDEVNSIWANLRATEVAVIQLPGGVKVDTQSPQGSMPDLMGMVQYCDQMIASTFSNEGNLLGLQTAHGSYAQAEVKERDFMRSAPYYARKVADPINDLLRRLCIEQVGELPEYPKLTFRLDGLQDNSRWIEDATKLHFNQPLSQWEPKWREIARQKMMVEDDFADEVEDAMKGEGESESVQPDPAAAPTRVEDTALNGAQVTSLVGIIQQVSLKMLPAASAIKIIMKAFLMTEEEARQLVDPASTFEPAVPAEEAARLNAECGHAHEMAEDIQDATEIDEEIQRIREKYAEKLGNRFAKLATEHKKLWSTTVRDTSEAGEVWQLAQRVREEMLPKYVDASLENAEAAAQEAGKALLRALGGTAPRGLSIDAAGSFDQAARLEAAAVGEKACSWQQKWLMTQQSDIVRGRPSDDRRSTGSETIRRLGTATLVGVAAEAITGAVHTGRDRVMGVVNEKTPGKIIAIRRNPRGGDTCGPCQALNGFRTVYGSAKYYENSPPNKCRGNSGCDCYWDYEMPSGESVDPDSVKEALQ